MHGDRWEDHLDPGERLLWTGAPARGLRFDFDQVILSVFGGVFLAFALLAFVESSRGLWGGYWLMASGYVLWFMVIFPLFALPFIWEGVMMAFGQHFTDARLRAQTRYALTDRRAIIAIGGREPSVRSWPIGPETEVDYSPGDEASLRFAAGPRPDGGQVMERARSGFNRIRDGEQVMELIRKVQAGTA